MSGQDDFPLRFAGRHQSTDSIASQSDAVTKTGTTSPLGVLATLPSEVRVMIYRQVLVASGPIANTHARLKLQSSIMVNRHMKFEDIDSTLRLTRRTIYNDAAHVLYGENNFLSMHAKGHWGFRLRRATNDT